MGWVGSVIGGAAGIISQPAKLEAINAQNEATQAGYKSTDEAITFTQEINRNNADAAASEIGQEASVVVRDKKLEQGKASSEEVVRRGEGVTAGYSAARDIQTMQVTQQKDLTKVEKSAGDAISQMYQNMEKDNFALQQEKRAAWNQANGQIITREEAGSQMIGDVLGGFQ